MDLIENYHDERVKYYIKWLVEKDINIMAKHKTDGIDTDLMMGLIDRFAEVCDVHSNICEIIIKGQDTCWLDGVTDLDEILKFITLRLLDQLEIEEYKDHFEVTQDNIDMSTRYWNEHCEFLQWNKYYPDTEKNFINGEFNILI